MDNSTVEGLQDPDSRDSGISMGFVGQEGKTPQKREREHGGDRDGEEDGGFAEFVGPICKRLKSIEQLEAEEGAHRCPYTDFRHLQNEGLSLALHQLEAPKAKAGRRLKHPSLLAGRTIAAAGGACCVQLFKDSHSDGQPNAPETDKSDNGCSAANSDGIPAFARCVHRAQSSSVLECSFREPESWGSPDALQHPCSLRNVERPQVPHRAFQSISAETLANLLESLTETQFLRRFMLVDCRYPYEFAGGHILHSTNIHRAEDIGATFFPQDEQQFGEVNARIPIFYCEFSEKRAPKMILALRQYDRRQNEHRYPYVEYKELYLLNCGYRHFFRAAQFERLCTPKAYTQMWDPAFKDELKQYCFHRQKPTKKRRRLISQLQ